MAFLEGRFRQRHRPAAAAAASAAPPSVANGGDEASIASSGKSKRFNTTRALRRSLQQATPAFLGAQIGCCLYALLHVPVWLQSARWFPHAPTPAERFDLPRVVLWGDPLIRSRTPRLVSVAIDDPMTSQQYGAPIPSSHSYDDERKDPAETDQCRPQYEWQTQTFQACNVIHEIGLAATQEMVTGGPRIRLLTEGYWRDVWLFGESGTRQVHVLKTQRYEHVYSERNFDRHRRDAVGTLWFPVFDDCRAHAFDSHGTIDFGTLCAQHLWLLRCSGCI